jgi:(methylthio)acryloyl-CoA hydratase
MSTVASGGGTYGLRTVGDRAESGDRAEVGVRIEIDDGVAVLELARPARRNALDNLLVERVGAFFADPPPGVRAAVLLAEGDHFCAGLDLDHALAISRAAARPADPEHRARSPAAFEAMEQSRLWHHAFEQVEHGAIPLVAGLQGAVIGGGLELALAAHVRIAEPSAFYSLPEGRLGIFVGGGGSVRIGRVLGADRMREMMLTGRRLTAEDGQRLGLSHELAAEGEARARALEVAHQIAANAPLTNRLILMALPRIADMARGEGLWAEALTAAVSQTTADAEEGMRAFLEKRPPEFRGA